jgi:hypothetical protein
MKPLKVRCHFCGEFVLDITCDKVVLERVVNTQPRIVKKKEVYRCRECKAKHEKRE